MGSLPPPVKLSLDVRPTFVPNTIGGFLREVAAIGDASRRSSRLEDLVGNLEEELRKIDAFKRELPLCMLLMQDAIITLKLELVQCTAARTDYQPMQLAELMPLKKGSDEVEIERYDEDDKEKDAKDKKNWKSCLQLWNSSTSFNNDSPTAARSFDLKEDRKAESTKGNDELEKNQETASEEDVLRKNGNRVSEFMPIFPRKEKEAGLELPLSLLTSSGGSKKSCSSSMEKTEKRPSSSSIRRPIPLNFQPSTRNSGEQQQQQNSRKQRRCWSPELHRRFISALQQLGGSQVATPKQIRELMQVDGLTNDEVKSHLQKYRLHTRRFPVASAANETKNQSNRSQFVLGGLWPSSSQDKTDESAKGNNNNNNDDSSGSPEGPLQLCLSAGAAASATGGGDSNSMEDDEDSKSRSFTWGKNHIHRPRTIGV